jgi:hypothetical protein
LSIAKPFLAINAKGPHHHYFKIFKRKIISKTLLKAKGRIFFRGAFI